VSAGSVSKSKCVRCSNIKAPHEFAVKSGRQEREVRRDTICKACKASEARARRDARKSVPKTLPTAQRTIEPKKRFDLSRKNTETSDIALHADFNFYEARGTKMTLAERYDAIRRFNEFIGILREGYGELKGCLVYVKKDK